MKKKWLYRYLFFQNREWNSQWKKGLDFDKRKSVWKCKFIFKHNFHQKCLQFVKWWKKVDVFNILTKKIREEFDLIYFSLLVHSRPIPTFVCEGQISWKWKKNQNLFKNVLCSFQGCNHFSRQLVYILPFRV